MNYKPRIVSATTRMKLAAGRYSATLLRDIKTSGMVRYEQLLYVYGPSPTEPVLIVSAEHFEGALRGPSMVIGLFDGDGHQICHHELGDSVDESKFVALATAIVKERLQIELRAESAQKPWWKFW